MADDAVLTARLAEAEDALHRLLTGAQEVSIEYEGSATTYSRSSEAGLRQYIRELKKQLGQPVASRSRRVVY